MLHVIGVVHGEVLVLLVFFVEVKGWIELFLGGLCRGELVSFFRLECRQVNGWDKLLLVVQGGLHGVDVRALLLLHGGMEWYLLWMDLGRL